MSRIEKALEKARQMRAAELATPAEAVRAETPAPAPRPASPVQETAAACSRTVSIKGSNPMLATINDPHSPISEQYRKLKSTLVRMTNEDRFRNLLMVASAVSGEGKSMSAINLAISMAQEFDLTVLLIDADLRRPSIQNYLGLEASAGLSDCLLDDVDLADVIVRTDIGKLSIIPAGREVSNPLELFSSKKMQELMAEIKHRYNDRYVIIDTPPLLPFAETRTLGHLMDGIIFVIQEGLVPKASIQEAIEALKGCPILGVLLNNSTSFTQESHGYGGYYGGYGKRSAEAYKR